MQQIWVKYVWHGNWKFAVLHAQKKENIFVPDRARWNGSLNQLHHPACGHMRPRSNSLQVLFWTVHLATSKHVQKQRRPETQHVSCSSVEHRACGRSEVHPCQPQRISQHESSRMISHHECLAGVSEKNAAAMSWSVPLGAGESQVSCVRYWLH